MVFLHKCAEICCLMCIFCHTARVGCVPIGIHSKAVFSKITEDWLLHGSSANILSVKGIRTLVGSIVLLCCATSHSRPSCLQQCHYNIFQWKFYHFHCSWTCLHYGSVWTAIHDVLIALLDIKVYPGGLPKNRANSTVSNFWQFASVWCGSYINNTYYVTQLLR